MKKKYLIVKGCAGLGNRLVTIFSAIKYCEKTKRKLIIDWTDGQFDLKGINAFEKCFELNFINFVEEIEADELHNLSHSSNLFRDNKQAGVYDLYFDKHYTFLLKLPYKLFINEYLRKIRRRWQPIKNGNYFNSIAYGSDLNYNHKEEILYFIDFLPQNNYFELPKYIKPKDHLQLKISNFTTEKNLKNAIGIHIRNTDKKPNSDISKFVKQLANKFKDESVFLSTDSKSVESIFESYFPEKLILYPKHIPELNNEGLHQWALNNNKNELKYLMFEESIIEMFLLSKCRILFYQGNSTFSNISRVYHLNSKNCHDWLKY